LPPRPIPSAGQGSGRDRSWIRCPRSNGASAWPISARNCGWKSSTCCSATSTRAGSRPRPTRWHAWCACLRASGGLAAGLEPGALEGRGFGRPAPNDAAPRALVIYGHQQIEDLADGAGWEAEYPRDVWRLRHLGMPTGGGAPSHLRFDKIPQPWLNELAKRWVRWRLTTGLGTTAAARYVVAVTRFAGFLASPQVRVDQLAAVDRALLERYLADLHAELAGRPVHRTHIGLLNAFLQAIRQHGWDPSLPATAMFHAEDYPKDAQQLPRALGEQVMGQLEHPTNLDRWDNQAYRLVTIILMRCGLRVSDAVKLAFDCLAGDADGAPYLRYHNHKMQREALVPIDEELQQLIAQQQRRVLDRWPSGVPVLFPRPLANPDGQLPIGSGTYRGALYRWLDRCDIRDEHGRPVHLTPHQWRHTLGTRLINHDVPQEVVRRILDHDSHAMTAHYARLHDQTVRRHWEQARKVNAKGQTVTLDPGGPLAEAAWARRGVKLRQLEPSVAVRGLHHRDLRPDALEPHHAVHPTALDRPLALQLESELDEERRRGREVVDHDAHVLHALDRHALDCSDTTAPATTSLGCRSAGGNAPPIGLKRPAMSGSAQSGHSWYASLWRTLSETTVPT
jgi:integrase